MKNTIRNTQYAILITLILAWLVLPQTSQAAAPVADDQALTINEDASINITLTATDADGDTLTYAIVTSPSHGSLTGTAPNLTYKPSTNYNGADSFTFKANDGTSDSNTATVSLNINPIDDPPVLTQRDLVFAIEPEENSVSKTYLLRLMVTEVDGDTLTYAVQNLPSFAHLDPNTGELSLSITHSNINTYPNIIVTVTDVTPAGLSATKTVNLIIREAKTYYCDPNGNTQTGDGSSEVPWGTLQSVMMAGKFNGTIIKSGDTLRLRTGFHGGFGNYTYNPPSFVAANTGYITIEPDTGAVADVNFLRFTNSAYWHFKGLRISPSFSNQVSKEERAKAPLQTIIYANSCNHITIEDCNIFTTSDVSNWRVHVTGTLSPDATGTYDVVGQYPSNGSRHYARRQDNAYYIWRNAANTQWHISSELGVDGSAYWIFATSKDYTKGPFTPQGTASGSPLVTNDWQDLSYLGIKSVYSRYWTVHGNFVHNTQSGIEIYGSSSSPATNNLIEQNVVDGFCDNGILIGNCPHCAVQDNHILNTYNPDETDGMHSDMMQIISHDISANYDITIRRNYMNARTDPNRNSSTIGNAMGCPQGLWTDPKGIKDSLIENNVIMCLHETHGIVLDLSTNVKVINNTLMMPYGFSPGGNGTQGWSDINMSAGCTNILIRNNIIHKVTIGNVETAGDDVNAIDVDHNFKISNYNPNVEFVDYVNGNVRLAAGSHFIDAGESADAPAEDLERNLRPQGQGYDVGAYEYGTSTTSLLYGDVNNDKEITAYDAALTAQAAVDLITLTPEQTKAADVNGDSEVTAYDAALIAQRAVGLIDKFPVEG